MLRVRGWWSCLVLLVFSVVESIITTPLATTARLTVEPRQRCHDGMVTGTQWWYDRVAEDQEDVALRRFARVLRIARTSRRPRRTPSRRSRRWEWWFRDVDACRG